MRFLVCIIAFSIAMSAFGNQMLITKKGEGFRIKSARKEGANIIYIAEDTGKEYSIPAADVSATIPVVTAGSSYTITQIDAAIAKVDKIGRKHRSMLRKVNVIKAEWAALKVSKTSDIGAVLSEIESGLKENTDLTTYRKALLDLGMMEYKHKGDTEKIATIGAAKKSSRTIYMGMDLDAFTERCAKKEIEFAEYALIREEAIKSLRKQCIKNDKTMLTDAVVAARTTILENKTAYGKDLFKRKPTLESYIKGLSMLGELEDVVARTEDERDMLAREKQDLISSVKTKFRSVDFNHNNFPLSRADLIYKKTNAPFCSSFECQDIKIEKEWAFIIPTRPPAVADLQSELNMPLTIIINRRLLAAAEYGIMIASGNSDSSINKHFIPLRSLVYKHAHATVRFRYDLKRAKVKTALRDADGEYILLYAAMRPTSSARNGNDSGWTIISQGCRIPVPYPPPEPVASILSETHPIAGSNAR